MSSRFKVISIVYSCPFSLSTQAVAVLSCNAGQVLPTVQCHENGSFSPGTSLSDWAAQCKWIGIGRICHLQRRAGKQLLGWLCLFQRHAMHSGFFPGFVVLGLAFVLEQTTATVIGEGIHVS